MAFADPQSLTVGASTVSLARVHLAPGVGTFEGPDSAIVMAIRPTTTKGGERVRQTLSIDRAAIKVDPLKGTNSQQEQRLTLILDSPEWGFSEAESAELINALKAWLTAPNVTKFVAGEN